MSDMFGPTGPEGPLTQPAGPQAPPSDIAGSQASFESLRQLLEQQKAALRRWQNANQRGGRYIVDGTSYTRQQFTEVSTALKANIRELEKAVKPYNAAVTKLAKAQALADQQPTGATAQQRAQSARQIQKAKTELPALQKQVRDLDVTPVAVPGTYRPTIATPPTPTTVAGVGPAGPTGAPAAPTARVGTTGPGAMGVIGPQGTPARPTRTGPPSPMELGGGAPTGGQAPTPPALTPSGVPGQPGAGGGASRGGVPGGKGTSRRRKRDWEGNFRRMFPDQAWMLDLDRSKYADVFALFERADRSEMWKSQEGQARFLAELKNTSFYKELDNKKTVTKIRDIVGDIGLEGPAFNRILRDSANLGWDDDTIKREVYSEAFKKDQAGNYVNLVAQQRAAASVDYLNVANIGRQFFTTIDQPTIEKTLTGQLTVDDVGRQQRELAKTKYKHLSGLIDQGFTLEQLAGDYKATASQILERPETDFNMSQADYEVALNFNDNGNYRVMTSGEWERLLKTDSRYGYGNTQQAQRQARDIAMSLVQSLGRVS